jgi:hypothetical protein
MESNTWCPRLTISRELRRNAATRSGGLEYRAATAQWHAERSARRPKQAKLVLNDPGQAGNLGRPFRPSTLLHSRWGLLATRNYANSVEVHHDIVSAMRDVDAATVALNRAHHARPIFSTRPFCSQGLVPRTAAKSDAYEK